MTVKSSCLIFLVFLTGYASCGTISVSGVPRKLAYKEIPMKDAIKGLYRNARSREPKQSNLLDDSNSYDPSPSPSGSKVESKQTNLNRQESEAIQSNQFRLEEESTITEKPSEEPVEPKKGFNTLVIGNINEPILPIDDIIQLGKGMESRETDDYEYDHQDDTENNGNNNLNNHGIESRDKSTESTEITESNESLQSDEIVDIADENEYSENDESKLYPNRLGWVEFSKH